MTDPEVACRAHNIYTIGKDYRRLNLAGEENAATIMG